MPLGFRRTVPLSTNQEESTGFRMNTIPIGGGTNLKKQPSIQSGSGKQHALVIGASIAGLLAARVLSDHFEQVTVIERDQLTDDAQPRKGVPQGRHAHALLARGASILGELFPDLFPALARDGAVALSTSDIRRYAFGAWMKPIPVVAKKRML